LRGTSMLVRGSATRGNLTETFNWSFRDRMRYRECSSTIDGVDERGLKLGQSENVDVDITLHTEALFNNHPDPAVVSLGFDIIASADTVFGNDDGDVTLEELAKLPLPPSELASALGLGDSFPTWLTFEEYLYQGAAATVARFRDTGHCTLRSGQQRSP
jgi:hypothetical protein